MTGAEIITGLEEARLVEEFVKLNTPVTAGDLIDFSVATLPGRISAVRHATHQMPAAGKARVRNGKIEYIGK